MLSYLVLFDLARTCGCFLPFMAMIPLGRDLFLRSGCLVVPKAFSGLIKSSVALYKL